MQKTLNITGTQRADILAKLRSAKKIPAYELAAIALQYCARIHELRKLGYVIKNEAKRVGGQIHSTFELIYEPEPFKLSTSGSNDPHVQPTFISTAVSSNFLAWETGKTRGGR